jgi:hypothetical protein
MARVKLEEIIANRLSSEIKSALEDAVKKSFPGVPFSKEKLFTNFVSEVRRRCGGWQRVSDSQVDAES